MSFVQRENSNVSVVSMLAKALSAFLVLLLLSFFASNDINKQKGGDELILRHNAIHQSSINNYVWPFSGDRPPPLEDLIHDRTAANLNQITKTNYNTSIFPAASENRSKYILREDADIQFILDFAVIGFPKCGSSYILHWLYHHGQIYDEILVHPQELHFLSQGKIGEFVEELYHLAPNHRDDDNPTATTTTAQMSNEKTTASTLSSNSVQTSTLTNKSFFDFKRGYKSPNDIRFGFILDLFRTKFPKTKLVIGVRHPIKWFQSYYNFNYYKQDGNNTMPPAEEMQTIENFPDRLLFHYYLSTLGKAYNIENSNGKKRPKKEFELLHRWRITSKKKKKNMNKNASKAYNIENSNGKKRPTKEFKLLHRWRNRSKKKKIMMNKAKVTNDQGDDASNRNRRMKMNEERKLKRFHTKRTRKRPPPFIPNPVFLYEVSQLSDTSDLARQGQFRRDLSQYLNLTHPLEPYEEDFVHQPETINICDDKFAKLRSTLLALGDAASKWIIEYFLPHPDVSVSSPDHFRDLLLSWRIDPCTEQQ